MREESFDLRPEDDLDVDISKSSSSLSSSATSAHLAAMLVAVPWIKTCSGGSPSTRCRYLCGRGRSPCFVVVVVVVV